MLEVYRRIVYDYQRMMLAYEGQIDPQLSMEPPLELEASLAELKSRYSALREKLYAEIKEVHRLLEEAPSDLAKRVAQLEGALPKRRLLESALPTARSRL